MTETNDEKDLIITALRQRVGQLVSTYEFEIAAIRAEYTKLEFAFKKVQESHKALLLEKEEKKALKSKTPTVEDLIGQEKNV